ncbi:MAG: hypothetical protein Q4G02_00670 [bacterium]|nr:hypothetical protein [bacterium]
MENSRPAVSRLATQNRPVPTETLAKSRINNPSESTKINEEKKQKLLLQLISLSAGAVVLLILFLTVFFPLMVHYTGAENSKKYNPEIAQIKPQTPMFNAPAAATNSAEIVLNGFTSNDTQVQFVIDGIADEENLLAVSSNGEFAFAYNFDEGEHTLSAYTIDKNGLQSDPTKEYQILIDQAVPALIIDDLKNDQEIVGKDKKTLTIRGVTEPQAQVTINSQRTKADADGNFTLDYTLQNGDNKLKILAYDQAGNQVEEELTIKFTP